MADGFFLLLEPYCAFCPDFEPQVSKQDFSMLSDPMRKVMTSIQCENGERCKRIMRRAKEMANEEAKNV